jgi:two-component system LytT family response regulator
MKLRAIIVDDEALARQGLTMRLEVFEDIEIVQEAKNAKEALEAIVRFEPDVVFLDIQMPGMTGLEMLEKIQADVMPLVIFVTAYDEFAVNAFQIHAIDYLLKPVENDRLVEAVTKAQQYKIKELAIHENKNYWTSRSA